jgi:hypothetical protein
MPSVKKPALFFSSSYFSKRFAKDSLAKACSCLFVSCVRRL